MNNTNARLLDLRKFLSDFKADAILIPMNASFSNYDSESSDIRLISGFSGSNGRAVVSLDNAILSVDGRYTTQASRQVDLSYWTIEEYPAITTQHMIMKLLSPGDTLVVSSMAHSYQSYLNLKQFVENNDRSLKTIDHHPVLNYREQQDIAEKIVITDDSCINNRVDFLKSKLADHEGMLIANKETISWIFGIRKSKVSKDKNPLANVIAFIPKNDKPILFCDLKCDNNQFFDCCDFNQFLNVMSSFKKITIKASYTYVPAFFVLSLIEQGFDVQPTKGNYASLEYIKTDEEIIAQKEGALETSISFIKTLAYVDYYVRKGEKITEKDAIGYFENKHAIDLSFNPICASGNNTSIVHYNPDMGNNSIICNESLFLFDAGFHFQNSTTDVTRTIYIGSNPNNEFKKIYTIILQAFIFYSMAKYPDNTPACCLDALCRYYIWQHGFDYSFGTGHGVGNYRSVHEAPRVSKTSKDLITKNMITTVEPGYYTDSYGIRLENMLLSVEHDNMLSFETITYIPFCYALIDPSILNQESINWLNNYHSEILRKFLPVFKNDPITTSWLQQNTRIF